MLGNLIMPPRRSSSPPRCVEEIFVGGRDVPPLLAVGLEGMFGMGVLVRPNRDVLPPGVSGLSETRGHLEDRSTLPQLGSGNGILLGFMLASLASIAFFNFFGISVTKAMSARTGWCSTACARWWSGASRSASTPSTRRRAEVLVAQLVGFAILLAGTLVHNEILPLPCLEEVAQGGGDGARRRQRRRHLHHRHAAHPAAGARGCRDPDARGQRAAPAARRRRGSRPTRPPRALGCSVDREARRSALSA